MCGIRDSPNIAQFILYFIIDELNGCIKSVLFYSLNTFLEIRLSFFMVFEVFLFILLFFSTSAERFRISLQSSQF